MNEQLMEEQTVLSPREQLLLEGYKEQTASWRHLDNILHRFTTIMLPLSIAALGVPYLKIETEIPKLPAMLGGLMLMIFWIASCHIIEITAQIRFKIIHGMEEELGIMGHREYRKRRKAEWTKILRSHYLRWIMFGVYIVAMVILFAFF